MSAGGWLREPGQRDSGAIQSVDRAAQVLEILARGGPDGVSVTDVATALDVHKSSASRLLRALENHELVEQDGDRGRYHLGFGVLRLANAVVGRLELVGQAREVLRELASTFGETVNLAVLRSHYAVNVDQARGRAAVAAQNWTGQMTPLHATSSGKVLLAYESADNRRRLLDASRLERYTARTVVGRRALTAMLDEVVQRGYAEALEEYEAGLNAVAAPIRDHTGGVIASVSVSGPAFRLDRPALDEVRPELLAGATRISARMGHLS